MCNDVSVTVKNHRVKKQQICIGIFVQLINLISNEKDKSVDFCWSAKFLFFF